MAQRLSYICDIVHVHSKSNRWWISFWTMSTRAILSRILTAQNMTIGQLTMQQLHIVHCTFRFYNCTNCDQLHVKICSDVDNDNSYFVEAESASE